jgi:hypothetical protein
MVGEGYDGDALDPYYEFEWLVLVHFVLTFYLIYFLESLVLITIYSHEEQKY